MEYLHFTHRRAALQLKPMADAERQQQPSAGPAGATFVC
jgi:hypothetical protein